MQRRLTWEKWLYRSGKAEDATVQRYGPFLYNSGAAFGGFDYRIERYGSSVPCPSPLSHLSSSLSTRLVLLKYIFGKSERLIEGLEEGAGFCGFMSILSSLRYALGPADDYTNIYFALAFIPFGLFFDFMDGKVARWRGKSSLMGQELDSLADLVRLNYFPRSLPLSLALFDFLERRRLCALRLEIALQRWRSTKDVGLLE